jgi:hypothetical protein
VTEWACVAVFEFENGLSEQRVLCRGAKRLCEAVADRLERDVGAVPYKGSRVEAVVGVALATCPVSALGDGGVVGTPV